MKMSEWTFRGFSAMYAAMRMREGWDEPRIKADMPHLRAEDFESAREIFKETRKGVANGRA